MVVIYWSPLSEKTKRLLMEPRSCGGDHVLSGIYSQGASAPVSDHPAGILHHRHEGEEIVGQKRRFYNEIAIPGRQQRILVAIAPKSSQRRHST